MLHKDVEKILFTEEQIEKRCVELGAQITNDYVGKKPLVVGLLKGSVLFMAELIQRIDCDLEIDFMDVSSYEGTESTHDIKILKDLDRSVQGEYIILVEDIIDTGNTLKKVKELLYFNGAKDVKIVSMLDKKERREVEIEGDYIGFECPNEFVIGFGLDFNQKYRNLPYIGVLKEECYKDLI